MAVKKQNVVRRLRADIGLRGDERRLASALARLQEGIPLSWGQIEDDDALATLYFLNQSTAPSGRSGSGYDGLRADVVSDLDGMLPQPKAVVVKEAPKTMAGFSERVQVLTQVEEDVPSLVSRAPQWAAAVIVAVVGVVVLFSLVGNSGQAERPSFKWIELHNGEEQISKVVERSYWSETSCTNFKLGDPKASRKFISLPDAGQLGEVTSFPVLYPPRDLPVGGGVTHTLRLVASGISPCAAEEPDPSDQGAMVRLEYMSYSRTERGRSENLIRMKVFEGRRIPVHLDVSTDEWERVEGAERERGVYWESSRYRDIEGRLWAEGARGLILEGDERVLMIIAEAEEGVDKGVLLAIGAAVGTGSPTDVAGGREKRP